LKRNQGARHVEIARLSDRLRKKTRRGNALGGMMAGPVVSIIKVEGLTKRFGNLSD
jgi:hypothetical protein